jgi:uncharacterized protein (UPF0261 family)
MKKIAIVGTLDTKFEEMGFIRDFIQKKGHEPVIIDAGIMGTVPFVPHISRDMVADAAGMKLPDIQAIGDEGRAIAIMAEGASRIVHDLYETGRIDAIISVGGTMGTSLGLAIMRELPIGLPKLMVSTIAFTPLVTGDGVAKDQIMMQAPVDLWGLNVINRNTLQAAAAAIVGMAEAVSKIVPEKPMIGVTTRGIMRYLNWIKPALEARGYEVVVSHCIGKVGGGTFETLVRQGLFSFVLDLCTGEVLEELNGGSLKAGPTRMEGAGDMGIPQIVAPGCMEYWHWPGSVETISSWRTSHFHNPLVLCVKATLEEMIKGAEVMAEKLNRAKGSVTVLYPKKGFDDFDKEVGGVFYDPEGHSIFLDVLRKNVKPAIKLIEFDMHINDQKFAENVIEVFDQMVDLPPYK